MNLKNEKSYRFNINCFIILAYGLIGLLVLGSVVCIPLVAVSHASEPRSKAPPSNLAVTQGSSPNLVRPETSPCYECFWRSYTPETREAVISFYQRFATTDPLIDADRKFILARVRNSRAALCGARESFNALRTKEMNPGRALLVEETLAFTAAECGADPGPAFVGAALAAGVVGQEWKASVYREMARGRFRPRFGEQSIRTRLRAPSGTRTYILGESVIRASAGWKLAVQMDRVTRDWISQHIPYDLSGGPPVPAAIYGSHEGSRIRDILNASPVTVFPIEGVLVARKGERWYAPDNRGIFRFEVLPDKVQYPATRSYGDLALLVDTHGISSLVEASLRLDAKLALGCGDHPEKMKAAFYLATRGVDVYFPCDRSIGDVLGYEALGTIIGSAPVRASAGNAVIGDQPVEFSVDETIVVQDTRADSGAIYYDAAAHYFRRLSEALPLRLEIITVDASGETANIIKKAEELGASAIALRVMTEADAASVRAWLAAS